MKSNKFWAAAGKTLAVVAATLLVTISLAPGAWAAGKYKVLYKFTGAPDGARPNGGLVLDEAGNLYGTTSDGGWCEEECFGTAFKLTPNPDGTWTESIIYEFSPYKRDHSDWGAVFPSSGLISDAETNLYGTTLMGGPGSGWEGTLFELSPAADGSWTKTELVDFGQDHPGDGSRPAAAVVRDASGNFYGTTTLGGAFGGMTGERGHGTVWKWTPGNMLDSVLYSFTGGADGGILYSSLVFDSAGDLYGTTYAGGTGACNDHYYIGCGTIFKLTPNPDGSWTQTILHDFTGGMDGANPYVGMIFDAAGNLYGTAYAGGTPDWNCYDPDPRPHFGCGTVFKLTPKPDGSWTEKVIHQFSGQQAWHPDGGLISDAAGNLYGTTLHGGAYRAGTVFKITARPHGRWTYTKLHSFKGQPAVHPYGALLLDKLGNLYGTTSDCGGGVCAGTVFEITP